MEKKTLYTIKPQRELGDIIPKKKRVKKEAKKNDRKSEIDELYAQFHKESKKVDAAIAKFDHKDIRSDNKAFYQTFFGMTVIVAAIGITTFVLVQGESGNITGASFASISGSFASLFKSIYFNIILGGIFGLLFVFLIHLIHSRSK